MSQQTSTKNFIKHLLIFVVASLALVLTNSVVSATVAGDNGTPKALAETSASFDTQLNEAKRSIQQYADDQIWLYTPTKQEGSFDTQLNQALDQIQNK